MTSPSRATLLLVVNARVATGDARRPWADAIAFPEGAPPHAGSSAELRKRVPAGTPLLDAGGAELRLDGDQVTWPDGQRLRPPR
ncbi:MAG: hypothetical protein JWO05_306 [Gemmatimonadetes bacterium]|nr:hypothetical protein [Gemmatimonadota bacterium]